MVRALNSQRRADIEIWRATLWGLQENIKEPDIRAPLTTALAQAPTKLYASAAFASAISALLEGLVDPAEEPSPDYWRVFDRALAAAEKDPSNSEIPDDGRWVELAINRPLGHVATAYFRAMYSLRLKTQQGIPTDQLARLDRIAGIGNPNRRLARVIAAARLSYLFAVDERWTRHSLLPSFDWADEIEATAVWQGFAWQARVSPDLWLELHKAFFDVFTKTRLEALGPGAKTLAQVLVLAGIEFPPETVPAERSRAAIRAMTDEMRGNAIWWLWQYVSQEGGAGDAPRGPRADVLWRERIHPWLKRCWPREREFGGVGISERLALVVLATSDAFPEAVEFIEAFLLRDSSGYVLGEISKSDHPQKHPRETLKLMAAVIDRDRIYLPNDLRQVLDRLKEADPEIDEEPAFREFATKLRMIAKH
jgi:hypothetical protein